MRRLFAVLLCLLLLFGLAAAEDEKKTPEKAKPLTPAQAADAALRAHKAQDQAALTELARKDTPDPWWVAVTLALRDERDCALAFAKAAPRPDVEHLVKYLNRRPTEPRAAHDAFMEAYALLTKGKNDEALKTTGTDEVLTERSAQVTRVHLLRAFVFDRQKRSADALAAYRASAELARELGYHRIEAVALERGIEILRKVGTPQDAERLCKRRVEVETHRGKTKRALMASIVLCGIVMSDLGDPQRADVLARQLLPKVEATKDLKLRADVYSLLGAICEKLRRFEEGIEYQERAYQVNVERGEMGKAGVVLWLIGVTLEDRNGMNAPARAVEAYGRFIEFYDESDGRLGELASIAFDSTAKLYLRRGALEQALSWSARYVRTFETDPDHPELPDALHTAAFVHWKAGEYAKALGFARRGIEQASRAKEEGDRARSQRLAGMALQGLDRDVEAAEAYEEALSLFQRVANDEGIASVLARQGSLCERSRDAFELYQRALVHARKSGDDEAIVVGLINLGLAHVDRDEAEAALALYEEATTFTDAPAAHIADAHRKAGAALLALVRRDDAMASYTRAMEIHESNGNRRGAAEIHWDIGRVLYAQGKPGEAWSAYSRTLELREALADDSLLAETYLDLGVKAEQELLDRERALHLFERARDACRRIEEPGLVCRARRGIGRCLSALGRFKEAEVEFQSLVADAEGRKDDVELSSALIEFGNLHFDLERWDVATALYERARKLDEEFGDRAGVAVSLSNLALIARRQKRFQQALKLYDQSRAIFEAVGDRGEVAEREDDMGDLLHEDLKDYQRARGHYERALELYQRVGNARRAMNVAIDLSVTSQLLHDHVASENYSARALEAARSHGSMADRALTLLNLCITYMRRGDYVKALSYARDGLAVRRKLGNPAQIADALQTMAEACRRAGRYEESLRAYAEAETIRKELGATASVTAILVNRSHVYVLRGECARALSTLDEAVQLSQGAGTREQVAWILHAMANVYLQMGDAARALTLAEKLKEQYAAAGDPFAQADWAWLFSRVLGELDRREEAIEHARAALRTLRPTGAKRDIAVLEINIAVDLMVLDRHAEALALAETVRPRIADTGDLDATIACLSVLCECHRKLGSFGKAEAAGKEALELAEGLGTSSRLINCRVRQAQVHLDRGAAGVALTYARAALRDLPRLTSGLAERGRIHIRQDRARVFDVGVRAALAAENRSEAWFFLESGRAGALLSALGGRSRIALQAIPRPLRLAVSGARAEESAAGRNLRRAQQGGKLGEIREARKALVVARRETSAAIERVQREATGAASIAYAKPTSLEDVRAVLQPGEVGVFFSLPEEAERALVFVVRRSGVQMLELGAIEAIEEAAAKVDVPTLRTLLVDPLDLEDTDTTVLLSPSGALASVPFVQLLGLRALAYIPSGTTMHLLRSRPRKAGTGVLALGDPAYGSGHAAASVRALGRGGRLAPLPASGDEARAVGDTVLVKQQATEKGFFEALGRRPRWRSVHLACHGLIDTDEPTRSSLALAVDDENDGFLTTLDLFARKIPTDLVVLSACETARGKVFRGEGVVGFTRAFMFAGSPRVICSLWRVDDEATQALMIKFYELWNPKDGAKGLGAAVALRKAQAYVRDFEDESGKRPWRDPYYWAAWVLWGLPE